jgi:hypothetical protein
MDSFKDVFKEDLLIHSAEERKRIAKIVYDEGRCGVYHVGTTKEGIILDDGDKSKAVRVEARDRKSNGEIKSVRICRVEFLKKINEHSKKFIVDLRNQSEISKRQNFIKGWNSIFEFKINSK